jgi:DNA segregation ATPase FtsK/SpoIIIE, S-DNA-T family
MGLAFPVYLYPMANRLKKTAKEKKPNPEQLVGEKEETVTWKAVAKDERTYKILGVLFLLTGAFLFIAFTSYLFTWDEDQDKVMQHGTRFLVAEDVKAANLLGRLGALTAHFFIYKAFGVASFLICTFFFIVGINLLLGKKVFSVVKNLKYVFTGLIVFSLLLAFLFRNSAFSWGGAFGEAISGRISRFAGEMGTAILLCATALIYIIWRFNPVFKLPAKLQPAETAANPVNIENSLDYEARGFTDGALTETTTEEETAEKPAGKGNKLKNDTRVVVIPPKPADSETDNAGEMKLIEREPMPGDELPGINTAEPPGDNKKEADSKKKAGAAEPENGLDINIHPPLPKKPKEIPPVSLELEINEKIDDEAEEEAVPEKVAEAIVKPSLAQPYEPTLDLRDYKYPKLDLLESHGSEKIVQDPGELEANKNQIITTLGNYDISIQKISATVGPTVTLYEIVPAPGVRISRIKNLEDDIALSLAALGIRIIAPIPGKGTIGIEVPNTRKTVVSMKTLLASDKFQSSNFSLPIAVGKKIDNENFIVDLATMPHLLMAGATGQGKSVGLNAILVSLLYKKHPSQLKLVLVDPKKVELSLYRLIEKHFLAKLPGEEESIITDTKKVVHTLNALCIEMDNRYDLLKEAGCRNIKEYNEKFVARKLNPEKGHQFLPFIVLVIDEFADLIMTAGKEVEMPIARLAQLARAIGIHLIIATQRPSVNIITGTIKANFPARIAFKVSSKIDSRTILDVGGAEQLIGKGDMLISYNGELTRLQCAFVDTPEVDKVVDFIGEQRGYPQAFLLPEYIDETGEGGKDFNLADRDPLFDDAARLIVQSQVGSTSLLQRRMKLGYNRAGRLMDQLEMAGIVGASQGSKARDVLIKTEADLDQHLSALG